MKKTILFGTLALIVAGCHNASSSDDASNSNIYSTPPATMSYTITNIYPHNPESFTEGLEYHDGFLYESGGDPDYTGKSKLARVELKTGNEMQKINLAKEYFGEGVTLLNGKIYQLTYKEQKCFVYDAKTFKLLNTFTYDGEGWGMTNDGKYIIMDNGSNNLYYRDPETFKEVKRIGVVDNNGGLSNINELEYVNGFIYANVWQSDKIVKIDPATGKVVAQADLTGILQKNINPKDIGTIDVLNGIAYDAKTKHFFITGKYWPRVFEIQFN
ncbi:MAG: glutaminyl-peptide cyclotransferase [Bacteroidota bacterium]|nr:glutaminyl-peptide cyclotransferase [Bacteroidota bacterium]